MPHPHHEPQSGDHGTVVPPVPIPNTEVKRCCADDSMAKGYAKVGRCQIKHHPASRKRCGVFCAQKPRSKTKRRRDPSAPGLHPKRLRTRPRLVLEGHAQILTGEKTGELGNFSNGEARRREQLARVVQKCACMVSPHPECCQPLCFLGLIEPVSKVCERNHPHFINIVQMCAP